MITEADENYLKEIYTMELDCDSVTTSMLSNHFGYSPATVTGMLKKLAANQWVLYTPYQGVILTDAGRSIALKVLRRHRLLEAFLVKTLNIPWDRVHGEAERLEHSLSDYLEERIDSMLGYPTSDPHGSPIPTLNGRMDKSPRLHLADLSIGDRAEIVEVNDRNPELLNHLDRLQLYPKVQLTIVAKVPVDGLISILVGEQLHVLGQISASQIMVRKITPTGTPN
jgi:DtxR family Mn-dependent transcriptional regulator